jgi:hypothetical protein
MVEIIAPEDMNNPKLHELFQAAYMKPMYDRDEDLMIEGHSGMRHIVTADTERKLLKFMSVFGLKADAPRESKLELTNRLNDKVVLVRFSMPKDDVLLADYFIPFDEGITALQVFSCLKWFDKVTIGAIQDCDDDDIVE